MVKCNGPLHSSQEGSKGIETNSNRPRQRDQGAGSHRRRGPAGQRETGRSCQAAAAGQGAAGEGQAGRYHGVGGLHSQADQRRARSDTGAG